MPTRPRHWLPIALVFLGVAAALLVWRGFVVRQATGPAAGAEPVTPVIELAPSDLATARMVDLSTGLPISGVLRAVNTTVVKARVAGELQGLTVREGDSVRAGQLIARISASDLGDRLRQAQQQAEAAQAQVAIAQRAHENNVALVDKGFISRTALSTSRANLDAAQANHRAAQAAVDVARKSVNDSVLRAPIDGQVAQRLAQPGERVAPEARIVEIVDLSQLELEAALSPGDAGAVRVGQSAVLRVEGTGEPVRATVVRINPSAQASSRSVLVYLSVAPHPSLRQGLFAQGSLATGHQRSLAVPLSAVRTDKPAPYVQVAALGRIVHQPVHTGAHGEVNGEPWVAVDGVTEGATVLRGSTGALREGTPVKTLTPDAPPGDAAAEKDSVPAAGAPATSASDTR